MSKRLMTEKELSEYTGITIQTLQKWRMLGKGPAFVKLGGTPKSAVRYEQAAVDRWIDSCRMTEAASA